MTSYAVAIRQVYGENTTRYDTYTVEIRRQYDHIRWKYGDNTTIYGGNTATIRPYTVEIRRQYGHIRSSYFSRNTPYTTRRKYGRKSPAWFTTKYGTYTAVMTPYL